MRNNVIDCDRMSIDALLRLIEHGVTLRAANDTRNSVENGTWAAAVELSVRQFQGYAIGGDGIPGASQLIYRALTLFRWNYAAFYEQVEKKLKNSS